MQDNEQMKQTDRYKEIYQNYNDDQGTGRNKEIRLTCGGGNERNDRVAIE